MGLIRRRTSITNRTTALAAPVLALVLTAGCAAGDGSGVAQQPAADDDRSPRQDATNQAAPAVGGPGGGTSGRRARSVVLISIDGLNPSAVERLGRRKAPHLNRLLRTGTGTTNARTARESTITMPNHTGMFTGRRVRASKGGHGVRLNSESALPSTVHASARERVASIFDVVHEAGGSTIVYSSKSKFRFFEKTWPKAIDKTVIDSDTDVVRRLRKDLRNGPRTLSFLHLSAPDTAGHGHGFMGKEYLSAVRRTDKRLGTLFRTIARSPQTKGRAAVVLTSDHGGKGENHHQRRRYANHRVMLVARGPGVKKGASLYALSPHVDPGRKRPRYGTSKPPVRNLAAGNLALQLIGLGPVPGSMRESRGLRVR